MITRSQQQTYQQRQMSLQKQHKKNRQLRTMFGGHAAVAAPWGPKYGGSVSAATSACAAATADIRLSRPITRRFSSADRVRSSLLLQQQQLLLQEAPAARRGKKRRAEAEAAEDEAAEAEAAAEAAEEAAAAAAAAAEEELDAELLEAASDLLLSAAVDKRARGEEDFLGMSAAERAAWSTWHLTDAELAAAGHDVAAVRAPDTMAAVRNRFLLSDTSPNIMLNSNFHCGFSIDQSKFKRILREKYGLAATSVSMNYPGMPCPYLLKRGVPLTSELQTGRRDACDAGLSDKSQAFREKYVKATLITFRTGNAFLRGAFPETVMRFVYGELEKILVNEHANIVTHFTSPDAKDTRFVPKKRTAYFYDASRTSAEAAAQAEAEHRAECEAAAAAYRAACEAAAAARAAAKAAADEADADEADAADGGGADDGGADAEGADAEGADAPPAAARVPSAPAAISWRQFRKIADSAEAVHTPSFAAFLVNAAADPALADPGGAGAAGAAAAAAPLSAEQVRAGISPVVISTQTKLVVLSADIDIDRVFWHLPVVPYHEPRAGIIKKQISQQCASAEAVADYLARRDALEGYFTEIVSEQDTCQNVNARAGGNTSKAGGVSYVDTRILFQGMTSKDLVAPQSLAKLTFIHCFTLNMRAWCAHYARWAEVHVKVFKTGKIILPGIVVDNVDMFLSVLSLVLALINAAQKICAPDAPPLHIRHDLCALNADLFGPEAAAEVVAAQAARAAAARKKKKQPPLLPAAAAAAAPRMADMADVDVCSAGCPGLLQVTAEGLPCCATCGLIATRGALDFAPEWKFGGDERGAQDMSRCGNPRDPLLPESSVSIKVLPAAFGGKEKAGMRTTRKWMSWDAWPAHEKAIFDETKTIARVGSEGKLMRCVMDTARVLFKGLQHHAANRGLNRVATRIQTLWLACQAHGCPRTVNELATLFRMTHDPKTVAAGCARSFEDLADSLALPSLHHLHVGPILPGDFVQRFASRMGLGEPAFGGPEPVQIALYVATCVARAQLIPENRPHAVAVGVLFYVISCCGLPHTKKFIWVALDKEVSEVTIMRCFTKLCRARLFPADLRARYPLADEVEARANGELAALPRGAGGGGNKRPLRPADQVAVGDLVAAAAKRQRLADAKLAVLERRRVKKAATAANRQRIVLARKAARRAATEARRAARAACTAPKKSHKKKILPASPDAALDAPAAHMEP